MLRRSRSVRYSLPFFYLFVIYLFIENEKGKKGRSDPPCQKDREDLFLPPLGSSWDLKRVGMGKERQVRDECVTTVVRP